MKYHYADHLSVRVDTDSSANVMRNYGSYPFGGTWYETLGTDKWKFTSYENDYESGLNYAGARYQSTRVGRFTALDPAPGRRRNPQSLNRYAYANNDPINLIDPVSRSSGRKLRAVMQNSQITIVSSDEIQPLTLHDVQRQAS